MSLQNAWSDILCRIKNQKEKQLVVELQTLVNRLEVSMQQMQQSRALTTQYEAIWDKLLVCRRSDLMAAVPLAGQRLEQLRCTTATLSTAAQQLLPALQSACGMLSAFAAVNRATAGELEQAGALTLALEKLQLAGLEDQLLVALEQATASCKQQLTAAAARCHTQTQCCDYQQQLYSGGFAQPAASASSSGNRTGGPAAAAAAAIATVAPQQQQQHGVAHVQHGSGHLPAVHQQHSGLQQQQQQQQQQLQAHHAEAAFQQVQSSVGVQQQQQQLQGRDQLPPATAHPAAVVAAAGTRQPIPGSATATEVPDCTAGVTDGLAATHPDQQQQQHQHMHSTTTAVDNPNEAVSGSLPSQELLAVLAAAEVGAAARTAASAHAKQAAAQQREQRGQQQQWQQQQGASNAWGDAHVTAEAAARAVGVRCPLEGSSGLQRAAAPARMQVQQQQ